MPPTGGKFAALQNVFLVNFIVFLPIFNCVIIFACVAILNIVLINIPVFIVIPVHYIEHFLKLYWRGANFVIHEPVYSKVVF
jgi:hypothetical protein